VNISHLIDPHMLSCAIKKQFSFKLGWLLLSMVIIGNGCSTTSDAYKSEKLSDNSFKNYRTYAFIPTTDTAYTNFFRKAPFEKMLGTAVVKQLAKKGMTLDTLRPDCLFTYKLVINRKYEVSQQQEVVYKPDVYAPAFDNQARIYTFSSNNRPVVYNGKMNVDTLREGSLVIDMIDIKENKVVWRGTAQGKRPETYQQPQEEVVQEIVKTMFKKFPR
jgi:hypothetical protein